MRDTNQRRYDPEDLKEALQTLKNGGLILYPTDTIWGIGCDATRLEAVEKVYKLKQRADAKALISITDSSAKLMGLMKDVPEVAYDLIEATTTPLTIIYPDVHGLAQNLLAEDGSAGIRVVDEPFCRDLCQRFRMPIVSTSANISGAPSPSVFADISNEIKEGVDYIVKYRQDERSTKRKKPSSIIKLKSDGTFKLIR
ncbi:MAG: L-threonylcarbamoyladenylate synthase [Porphyromonas sp.]|nr:L-threonylcarbamoyladenylate synthase [Porphyromonas sp.]